MSRRHIRLRMKDGSGPGKITDVARDGSPVVRHTRPLRKKGASSGRIVTGVYMANLRGYGFARPVDENWKDGDIYISRDCTNGAWDRDTVEVRLLPKVHGRKQSGTVTRILSRGVNEVIGTAERDGHVMLVIPDDLKLNRTVLIPDEARNGAKDGDKVLAEITDYGRGRHANPVGAVREVFGPADAPGVDIFAIARGENLPMEFSEKQLRQAERCPDHVLDSDFEGRRDLRDWQLVTIDGPDAKDLDDAVSLTEHPDGYTLGVHIADVSNYVQESSQLDREALRRGTSVYLADRVIPMLPEALSNGICSLNAGEDRLALSVIMELDRGGRVTAHEIVESVIRVGERMSYPDVSVPPIRGLCAALPENGDGLGPDPETPDEERRHRFRFPGGEDRAGRKGDSDGDRPGERHRGDADHRGFHADGQRDGGGGVPEAGAAFPLPRARRTGSRQGGGTDCLCPEKRR